MDLGENEIRVLSNFENIAMYNKMYKYKKMHMNNMFTFMNYQSFVAVHVASKLTLFLFSAIPECRRLKILGEEIYQLLSITYLVKLET